MRADVQDLTVKHQDRRFLLKMERLAQKPLHVTVRAFTHGSKEHLLHFLLTDIGKHVDHKLYGAFRILAFCCREFSRQRHGRRSAHSLMREQKIAARRLFLLSVDQKSGSDIGKRDPREGELCAAVFTAAVHRCIGKRRKQNRSQRRSELRDRMSGRGRKIISVAF